MEPLRGEAFVVGDPTYGRGKKWESKKKRTKNKQEEKMWPSCDHFGFLAAWIAWWETEGGEGGKIK